MEMEPKRMDDETNEDKDDLIITNSAEFEHIENYIAIQYL